MFNWFTERKKTEVDKQRERLSCYLDGTLSPRERARLEQELAQDATLRGELDELRQTITMVRSLPIVPVPRSFMLDPAVYGREKPRRVHLYPVMRAATAVMALLLVVLYASDLFLGGVGGPAEQVSMATAPKELREVLVTEQVEAEVVVTRLVEEELVVTELTEGETVAEVARESIELAVEEEAEGADTEMAAPQAEVAAEPPAGETKAMDAESQEPGAALLGEAVSPTAAATPPAATLDGGAPAATPTPETGVGAGGVSPTTTPAPAATSLPTPTQTVVLAPYPAADEGATEDWLEMPYPEPAAPERPETVEGVPQEAEAESPTPDYRLIGRLGLAALVLVLLAATFLVRRLDW